MSTVTNPVAELLLFRRAHVGAARRAARTWELLTALKACRLRLSRAGSLNTLASNIYYNAGYDASERYETLEEFLEALTEDVDGRWLSREVVAGEDMYVLRPFFAAGAELMHDLRLGYLRGCDPKELDALNVAVPVLSTEVPAGVTDEEIKALTAYHRAATIRLVNRLRHLHTALHYVRSALADIEKKKPDAALALLLDDEVPRLVEGLTVLAELPFLPAPKSFFGTEADRVNPLRTLEADEGLLAPLLVHV